MTVTTPCTLYVLSVCSSKFAADMSVERRKSFCFVWKLLKRKESIAPLIQTIECRRRAYSIFVHLSNRTQDIALRIYSRDRQLRLVFSFLSVHRHPNPTLLRLYRLNRNSKYGKSLKNLITFQSIIFLFYLHNFWKKDTDAFKNKHFWRKQKEEIFKL